MDKFYRFDLETAALYKDSSKSLTLTWMVYDPKENCFLEFDTNDEPLCVYMGSLINLPEHMILLGVL